MKISFHGVRGSFPCSRPANIRYGANTSAVSVEVEGEAVLLLDLGTGLPLFTSYPPTSPFRGVALVTHLHLDHIAGLPFFPPIHRSGTQLDVYGPAQEQGSLREAFEALLRPPYYPVPLANLTADVRFHEVWYDELMVSTAKVVVRPVPHRGPAVGYRVSWNGVTIAYISDHQAPMTLDSVSPDVRQLCDGVDLLIHEAQYTREEFADRPDWGHCTVDYAVLVAQQANVRRLCLFHHDPNHSDDELDTLLRYAQGLCAGTSVDEVMAAADGLVLELAAPGRLPERGRDR